MSKCSWDSGSRPRFERSGSRGRASFVPAAWGRVPPSLHTRPRGTTVRAKGNNLRIEVDGRGKLSCGVGQTRLRVGTMFPSLGGRRLHALPAIRSNSPRRRPLSTRHDNWWHATTFGGVLSGYQTSAQAGYLKTIRMRVGRGTSWMLAVPPQNSYSSWPQGCLTVTFRQNLVPYFKRTCESWTQSNRRPNRVRTRNSSAGVLKS